MSLALLSLLFTLGVLAHNAEEAVWLPRWSGAAGQWRAPVSARQFRWAIGVLSALLVMSGIAAFAGGPRSGPAYLFAGYVFAMTANVLVPHVLGSLVMRAYLPGTATAVLLNAPLGGVLLYRMVEEGFVDLGVLVWTAPLVAVGLAGSIPVLFWLAGARRENSP